MPVAYWLTNELRELTLDMLAAERINRQDLFNFLSLAGLIGVPMADMQVRNIGVIGYAVVTPFVFFLLGIIIGRAQPEGE